MKKFARQFLSGFFGICAALSLTQTMAVAGSDPIFDQLKNYRTYYWVSNLGAEGEHFQVWFDNVEQSDCQLSGNSVAEIAALSEEDMECVYGALSTPPTRTESVPTALQPLAAAVEARIRDLYPDLSNLKLQYSGRFRRLTLTETIPGVQVSNPHATYREAARGELSLWVNMAQKTLRLAGGIQQASGMTGLCLDFDPNACKTAPDFLDFSRDAKNEGKLLSPSLLSYLSGVASKATPEMDRLQAAVFAYIRDQDQSTYVNPVSELLKRQGSGVLPPSFNQEVEFSFMAYGRANNFRDQRSEESAFRFSVPDALRGPVMRRILVPAFGGLEAEATLDLKLNTLTVRVTCESGERAEIVYGLSPTTIVSGADVALPLSTELTFKSSTTGKSEVSFKSPGKFTGLSGDRIDVYFNSPSLNHVLD